MSFPINLLRQTRQNILGICDGLTLEQLNHIPEGFNNNIAWNVGHCVATQQLLCYALAQQEMKFPMDFINSYRKGSKPEGPINGAEWTFIKDRLFTTIDAFEADLSKLDFSNFKEYTTSYGTKMTNIGQALSFNNTHEGMHLGTILALRKLV